MEKKFKNEEELIDFANQLIGHSVDEVFSDAEIKSSTKGNKGRIGHLVEESFFGYKKNNKQAPDFEKLGIELKVTPLKELKNGTTTPKERMVLSMLNHEDIVDNEDLTDSQLWIKMRRILIIWYLYSPDFRLNKFTLVHLLKTESEVNFNQLKKDWVKIRKYIIEGKAHELSESITKYLSVSRKGSGGKESKIKQPFSEEKYYKRAFTLKPSYMRKLQESVIGDIDEFPLFAKMETKLVGKQLINLAPAKYRASDVKAPKQFAAIAVNHAMGFTSFKKMSLAFEEESEFKTVKTIPVVYRKGAKSFRIKESFKINVPISNEANNLDWEDSEFSKIFNNEFVCVLYIHNEKDIKKSKIMNVVKFDFKDKDIDFVIDAYNEFRRRTKEGGLVSENGNVNFIKISDKVGVHFRPWATNKKDTFTTSYGETGTKTALWLNPDLIESLVNKNK